MIGPRLVLSAAHCSSSDTRFRVGARTGTSYEAMISIQDSIIHPDYSSSQFPNDIMMFYLDEATNQSYIQPEQNAITGGTFTVIGLGDTDPGSSLNFASVLQEVEVDYVDNDTCDDEYKGFGPVTDDMLCASGPDRDACAGDSGGRKLWST